MRHFLVSIILAISLSTVSAQVLSVSTLAGSTDGGGYLDARGTAARFSDPLGVAVDSLGNVFVADSANQVIRKITPARIVTTFAGTPNQPGSSDGKPGRFRFPVGIAINQATNDIYVADAYNLTIRKITPDGMVSTVAGQTLSRGAADGKGSAARFNYPLALAVTPDGTLFVADTYNDSIRRITPDGVVSTFASVYDPEGIAVDPVSGIVYVACTEDSRVVKIASDGKPSLLAGSYGEDNADGTGSAAHFVTPRGLVLDVHGNLALTDQIERLVRQITPAGVVTTLAGKADFQSGLVDGNGANARFGYLNGIAADAAGNLYITDEDNQVIRRMTPSRDVITFAGDAPRWGSADGTGTAASFTFPGLSGIAVDDDGNSYVADLSNVIKRITPSGVVTTIAGLAGAAGSQDGTGSAARFNFPTAVAIDRRDGSMVVADTYNQTIRRVTRQGIVTTVAGHAGVTGSANGTGTAATFNHPHGLTVDASANIYVADYLNGQIRKITPEGVVSTVPFTRIDQILAPTSVAVDAAGNIFVADGNTIKKVTPDGVVSKFVGSGGYGFADGTGTLTLFASPSSIAFDRDGNLYVADLGNYAIRRVTPAGVVTTVAGMPERPANVNGPGIAARFAAPGGIAMAPDDRLVIADGYNHAIRMAVVVPTVRSRAAAH